MSASEYAKSIGYDDAKYLHKWKGYRCYKPISKDADGETGLPLIILEKSGKFRISTVDEALDHFDDMGWSD